VATLFEGKAPTLSSRERELATDICKRLTRDVEMSIRLALAERIADNEEAPRELVLLLADDRIEVARPVLLRSRALTDDDLVRLVRSGGTEHQVTIASRSNLAEVVTAALAESPSDRVIVTLVRNPSAKIGKEVFEVLSARARGSAMLHVPLIERADLPPGAAVRLFGIVSDALKSALAERYPAAASALSRAVDETAKAMREGSPNTSEENAAKLVAKLAQGGQLRASFLLRVLSQGQMDLFEHGFAVLLDVPVDSLRHAMYRGRPRTVALACRAAGIDRSVFSTVYDLARRQRYSDAHFTDADREDVNEVFTAFTRTAATQELKATLSA
jgi:uncharacterized protein (DUF2336 family)